MTEKSKLEGELNILETISQVQSGFPSCFAHKCSKTEAVLTESFINTLKEVHYPLDFIGESTVTSDAFWEAIHFMGGYYQLDSNPHRRHSYYQIAGIDQRIIITDFEANRQFLHWLEINRPGYQNNVPKHLVTSNDVDVEDREILLMKFDSKGKKIYFLSWYERHFREFARMNNFEIEKASKIPVATE